jgi:hypothetical protein
MCLKASMQHGQVLGTTVPAHTLQQRKQNPASDQQLQTSTYRRMQSVVEIGDARTTAGEGR